MHAARSSGRIRSSPQAARETQQFVGQIQSAKLARAVSRERQLNEVMVDFWENHFSVFAGKGQTRLFLAQYDRDVIRPHALGKFRDLLGAVAKSPAMLFFLDNWQSAADSTQPTLVAATDVAAVARSAARHHCAPPGLGGFGGGRGQQLPPAVRARLQNATPEERQQIMQRLQQQAKRGLNENYARELMELHTLGVDGGYTQKDVQEVARALTGWTFNRQTGEFVFNPAHPRRGREDDSRPQIPGRSRRGRGRAGARSRRACAGDGALHHDQARAAFRVATIRRRRSSTAAPTRSRRPTATFARRCAASSRRRSSSAAPRIAPR